MSDEKNKHPLFGDMKLESVQDIGDTVICDICNADYTKESKDSGGFLFGSYAYCPKCAVESLPKIKAYHEEHLIKAWCPEGVSFHDWVMKLRGGDNTIKVYVNKKPNS